MNRAERRRLEKNKLSRNITKYVQDDIIKRVENERVEALMTCFVWVAHEQLGLGKDECLKLLQGIDTKMAPWIYGDIDCVEMKKEVEDKVGIIISC